MTTDTVTPEVVDVVDADQGPQESRELVHPASGEVLELKGAASADLAKAVDELAELNDRLALFGRAVVAELVERADRDVTRKLTAGPYIVEVNAPTDELYDLGVLREELDGLVKANLITQEAADRCIRVGAPKVPPPAADKRELNKLKRHPSDDVKRAVGKARRVVPTRRNARVIAATDL